MSETLSPIIQPIVDQTGLSRDELIDRLLVGAYTDGSLPSADQLLSQAPTQVVVEV